MGLLDRFRSSRQQSVLPQEVKQYYQTEQRQRRGVALALGLGALIATIAVVAALFLGGRFVYNQIRGNDSEQGTTSSTTTENTGDVQEEQPNGSSTEQQPANNPPATPPAPAPTPTPAQPTTPALGDSNLPRTGDEGM